MLQPASENIRVSLFEVLEAFESAENKQNQGVKSLRWSQRGMYNDRRVFTREVSLEKRAAICKRFAYTRRASPRIT